MQTQNSKSALILALLLAGAAGCEDRSNNPNTTAPNSVPNSTVNDGTRPRDTTMPPADRPTTPSTGDPARTPSTPAPAPRTTPGTTDPAVQPSPGNPAPPTPPQPSGADRDRAISEEIRAMIRHDSAISALAESIEISTQGGVVSLRGRVMTQEEKDAIEAKARQVSGVLSVANNLEVDRR